MTGPKFTAIDITTGDLVADLHLTVIDVHKLDRRIMDQTLYAIRGRTWNTDVEREYFVPANRELEVWE